MNFVNIHGERLDVSRTIQQQPTLTDRSRVSVRMFIEKLGVHEVSDAMERACTNTSLRKNMEFKYFCGICWRKVKEGS